MNNTEIIDIVRDLKQIYVSCMESYVPKIYQTVNDKYTVIDKSMLAIYLYIMIIENREIKSKTARDVLKQYITKQTIYSEVGNIQCQDLNSSNLAIYNSAMDYVICGRFEHMNRTLKKLKFNYTPLQNNEFTQLILFLEDVAEFAVFSKMIMRGNQEAEKQCNSIKEKIISGLESLTNDDFFKAEKTEICTLIKQNQFENSNYNKLLSVALNLKNVYRFSLVNVMVKENVLFHQYAVAVTSICLADYLNDVLGEKLDIYNVITSAVFHDFSEYKGTEITSHIKNYNEDTKKAFSKIEEADESELKEILGNTIFEFVTKMKKNEPESWVCELMDKFNPFIKMWVEVTYYNNLEFIKHIPTIYREKLKRFLRINLIDGINNKSYFLYILMQAYVLIKKELIEFSPKALAEFFTNEEIQELKDEIQMLENNPELFFE